MRLRHQLSRHLPIVPRQPQRVVWRDHRLPGDSSSSDINPCCVAGGRDGIASQLITAQQLLSQVGQQVSWGSILPEGPADPAALKEDAASSRGHFSCLWLVVSFKP